MPDIKITITGRDYMVACNPGEEQRLKTLGAMVDASAHEAGGGSGSLNETRTLLFAALLLADKLHDAGSGPQTVKPMCKQAQRWRNPPMLWRVLRRVWKISRLGLRINELRLYW